MCNTKTIISFSKHVLKLALYKTIDHVCLFPFSYNMLLNMCVCVCVFNVIMFLLLTVCVLKVLLCARLFESIDPRAFRG